MGHMLRAPSKTASEKLGGLFILQTTYLRSYSSPTRRPEDRLSAANHRTRQVNVLKCKWTKSHRGHTGKLENAYSSRGQQHPSHHSRHPRDPGPPCPPRFRHGEHQIIHTTQRTQRPAWNASLPSQHRPSPRNERPAVHGPRQQ